MPILLSSFEMDSQIYRQPDGRTDRQTDRQTDMINHQKPTFDYGILKTFHTAGLRLNKRRQRWL